MTDKVLEEVMPTVQIELEQFGMDFFEVVPSEYLCYAWEVVRPAVLLFLTKNHAKSLFIQFFMENEEQKPIGLTTVQ